MPGDARTQVGFIAYNSELHFYGISEGYNQPHEMTVTDIEGECFFYHYFFNYIHRNIPFHRSIPSMPRKSSYKLRGMQRVDKRFIETTAKKVCEFA